MQERSQVTVIAVLAPLAVAFAFALDIYIPALPDIIKSYHTNQFYGQMTLSLFMFGSAIGQLFIGPLSDQFGRKRVVMNSIVIFVIASVLCMYAKTIVALIVLRVFQAFGACGMSVTANAVVRDLYDENESGRIYSYLNGCIAVSPLFAPVIGGYIAAWLGWRANFTLLAIFGLMTLLVIWLQLKETLLNEQRRRVSRHLLQRYWNIFKNKHFIIYGFAAATGFTCFFTFFSISPYILIELLHVEMQHFAFYFSVLGVMLLIGSAIAAQLSVKIGVYRTTFAGVLILLLGAVSMGAWYYVAGLSRWAFVVPMIPLGLGAAFVVGVGVAGALHPFKEIAGSASALLGCLQFLMAAVVGSIAMCRPIHSTMPLVWVGLVLGILSLVGVIALRRQQ